MEEQRINHDYRKVLESNYRYHNEQIKRIQELKQKLDKEIEEHNAQAEWYLNKWDKLMKDNPAQL